MSYTHCLNIGAFIYIAIISMFLPSRLESAAPITHAVLALEWIQKQRPDYTDAQIGDFLKGTLFNDCRKIAHLSRQVTHQKYLSLEDVLKETDAFQAGVTFHSWVDDMREYSISLESWASLHCALSNSIDLSDTLYLPDDINTLVTFERLATYVKFLEDELLYNEHDWSFLLKALSSINPESYTWPIPQATIQKWYKLLIAYFSHAPSQLFQSLCNSNTTYAGLSADTLCLWGVSIPKHTALPEVEQHVTRLLSTTKNLIRSTNLEETSVSAQKEQVKQLIELIHKHQQP